MREKLKIGLLLDTNHLRSWEYVLIERLIQSSYATVQLAVLIQNSHTPVPLTQRIRNSLGNFVFDLYIALDKKIFKVRPNANQLKDASHLIDKIPKINVKPVIETNFSDICLDDISAIASHQLDVLLDFNRQPLGGMIFNTAKYGIWSYCYGTHPTHCRVPPGFWEVMECRGVTESSLQLQTDECRTATVLYRSFSQTDSRSIQRNMNKIYWKSLSFVPRKLEELQCTGNLNVIDTVEEECAEAHSNTNAETRADIPNNLAMIRLIVRHLTRFIRDKLANLSHFDQWILLFNLDKGRQISFAKFTKIIPPKDRIFADPFVIQNASTYCIFIEELVRRFKKGHISVIQMDENGDYGAAVQIIERPYHLSYPFVFRFGNDYFLIAESSSNETIELYTCVEFPLSWKFDMNLMENVKAVDSTLFHYQDRWWLFANIAENPGASTLDELFLFYAENFRTNAWIPHPLNPVVSDVRKSRPAGKIFLREGKIIRPSQNSSNRYGYGLKMNEIVNLSDTEFDEVEVDSIEPDWDSNIVASHTINSEGYLTIIDGVLRRRRLF